MLPGSARKLLMGMGMVALATAVGCILPPDFEPVALPPTAPTILLDTPYPAPLVYIDVSDRGCTRFEASAELDDLEDTQLQFRWVANDGIAGKRTVFIADQRGLKLQGENFQASRTIVPADDFPDEYELARTPQAPPQTVLLTLFANDAPDRNAWEVPVPEDTGDAQSLGRLASVTDGGSTYHVVRIDWTLVLQSGLGECP